MTIYTAQTLYLFTKLKQAWYEKSHWFPSGFTHISIIKSYYACF